MALDTGKDKVKHICDILKHETLEPALQEAEEILTQAKKQAEQIICEAKRKAEQIRETFQKSNEEEKVIFRSALQQAAQLMIETLKHKLEQTFFNEHLEELLTKEMSSLDVVSKMINAVVTGIERDGISKDFTVFIPSGCSSTEMTGALTAQIFEKLESSHLELGAFRGGIQVRLSDKKLTLTITEKEISEFLKNYIRKDFRQYIFTE